MWSFVAITVTLIYGTFLTADGDLRFLNRISAIAIVINVGFNFLLIPKYGALGTGFSMLFTQVFIASCQIVRVHRRMRATHPLRTFIKFIALALCMSLMVFLLPKTSWVFAVECLGGMIFLLAFRLIDIQRIRLALSEKR
jgi:O-antigen/teichoic acid export membrane protein